MVTRQSLSETYRTMAHLRRFFESVRRTITTESTDGGLTPAQQFALLTLAGNPSNEPLTIGDLARQTFATMNHDVRPHPTDGARGARPHEALLEGSPLRLREADSLGERRLRPPRPR